MAENISTFNRLRAFQVVNRDWRDTLTITERDLLNYLVDNTFSYGRDWIRVTVDQMVSGTDWGLSPIGMARRTIYKVIGTLREKGVLVVKSVNRKVNEYRINLAWRSTMLPTPKKKRSPSAFNAPKPKSQCISCTPKIDSKTKPDSISGRGAPQHSSAEQLVEEIKARRPKAVKRTKDTVWASAWREAFPDTPCPAVTRKVSGQLRMIVERYPNGLEVLEHAVLQWREIRARQFGWMDKFPPPKTPDPGFILKHVTAFADDHAEHARRAKLDLMPTDERTYAVLRDEGKTHEEALIELGRRKGLVGSRGELAEQRERLERMAKALEQRATVPAPVRRDPAPRKADVEINHGDNPWENGGGEVADFSDLGEWEE